MTSGSKTGIERTLRHGLLGLALACALLPAQALAFDLRELMGLLAQHKGGEARFTEQRFVHGLEGPLEASGTLSFQAPDRLVRETLTPRPESVAVQGNALTLSRGGRTRTMALDSMPELQGMLEAMRSTLNGDAPALQRYFRSQLSGSRDNWTLELTPIDPRLAAQLDRLRLTGRAGEVLGIEMAFRGGDRSVMNIQPLPPVAGPARPPP